MSNRAARSSRHSLACTLVALAGILGPLLLDAHAAENPAGAAIRTHQSDPLAQALRGYDVEYRHPSLTLCTAATEVPCAPSCPPPPDLAPRGTQWRCAQFILAIDDADRRCSDDEIAAAVVVVERVDRLPPRVSETCDYRIVIPSEAQ
jgi:hypothetical protein